MSSLKREGLGQRFAAIIDLENLMIVNDRRLPLVEAGAVLSVVDAQVAGMPARTASGIMMFREYMGEVASRGWGRTLVNTTPDAADHALIQSAQQFIDCGVTDLIVASGDHAFVPLASQARLHVVTHANHLSRRLRLAATTVTYVPRTRGALHIAA